MNPKQLLEQYAIAPKKSLGQNFLHDPNTLEKIASLAELTREDTVLEIGPGTGALTEALARQAGRVIAVEVDTRLQPLLEERFAAYPHVELVFADILSAHHPTWTGDDYVVVANVPYYITSAILRHLLETEPRPRRLVMTVQAEVAERLVAVPGEMSLLSVSAQYYGRPRIVMRLKPAVFWPRPDVDSAVVRIDLDERASVAAPDASTFFRVARAGFSQKRKQLKNSLAGGLSLDIATATTLIETAGIDPRRRPETLSLEEWARLAQVYAQHV